MSERRTLGWYVEHPRQFDADVEAWQADMVDRYLDEGPGYNGLPPADCDEPDECTCPRGTTSCERLP